VKFILVYRYPEGYDVLTDPGANDAWEAFIRTLSTGGSVEVGPLVELPAAHPAEDLRRRMARP